MICECDSFACLKPLLITEIQFLELQEKHPDSAIVLSGHQSPDDIILEEHDNFLVVRGGLVCPYCEARAPYGDQRLVWISMHFNSRLHRWWCKLRRKY